MKHLNENFNDPRALFLLAYNFLKTDNTGAAYNTFLRAGELNPGEPAIWHNIGKCYHEIQDNEKADEFFHRALKVKPDYYPSLEGLSLTKTLQGRFDEVIHYANRALAENPEATESRINRAMAYLVKGRWLEGWRDYDANLGKEKNRKEMSIGDEPRWDGTKGLDIYCYGEQGIGDEQSFASCLPDLIRDSKSVIIECDGRIEGLLKRSFPTCEVHGTRYKTTTPQWKEGRKVDAKVALGQLPKFYRNKDSDFPGTAYLTPNPLMALQWKAALKSLGDKPKIGIAWTGGIPKTGQKRRSVTLDTFAPLFKYDADWISLQYKEPDVKEAEDRYGIKVHDWEWGNRVANYDQTVALISELDLVISVCTTVVHAAGGLGKECWCLVPEVPMWRYLDKGEWFPWAKSVTLYRQKGREWPTGILLGKLRDKFGDNLRKAA
jgi:tetratricopeptide (TPR) repeat protein